MLAIHLDAISSFLSFAGGAVLVVDALMVQRRIRQRRGAEILVAGFMKADGESQSAESDDRKPADGARPKETYLIVTPAGKPLANFQSIEEWFAERTFRNAWIGFSLLTVGFALDIFCKVIANPLVFR